MSNSTLKILPSLMVAIFTAWFAQPAWAQAVEPTLTLTEVSDTQLNWAWDAAGGGTSGSITTLFPDTWGFTPISGPNLNQPRNTVIAPSARWAEPGDPGFHNFAALDYFQGTIGQWTISIVNSDTPDLGFQTSPDGTAVDVQGLFKFAFVDSAAASEGGVPDTGTTCSLFGLSLTGLAFLRRKLC